MSLQGIGWALLRDEERAWWLGRQRWRNGLDGSAPHTTMSELYRPVEKGACVPVWRSQAFQGVTATATGERIPLATTQCGQCGNPRRNKSSVPQPTPSHAAFCPSQMQGVKLSNQPRQREVRPFGPCTLRVWAAAKRPPASMDPRAN